MNTSSTEEPAAPWNAPEWADSTGPDPNAGLLTAWRAWWALVAFSFLRLARARQMVWIALALFVFTWVVVAINSATGLWGMSHRRYFGREGPTAREWVDNAQTTFRAVPLSTGAGASTNALFGSYSAILDNSGFLVFAKGFVILMYLSFLLPMWCLSFGTEAIGGERESQSLVWLLTRPIPRPAIYLAKFLALLPWSLGLNLLGFWILCHTAGQPGEVSFRLFWPAVFWATLAFSALYCFMGAFFRRAAVVAIVYSLFLEVILGNMPGTLKRVSVGFYARCMMFEAAGQQGLEPENPTVYAPVEGATAQWVLIAATVVLVALGMMLFRRKQYETAD